MGIILRIFFFLIIMCFVFTGCTQPNKQNGKGNGDVSMVGYVVKKDKERILVTSFTPNRDNAVWIKTKDNISIGEQIEVFIKGEEILTTNPGQAVADRIVILKTETIGNPTHKANEVLKELLIQNTADWEIPIVKEFIFISEEKKWSTVIYDSKNKDKSEKNIFYND